MSETTTPNPLRALRPIDDASAARLADPQTHAELLEAILASSPAGSHPRAPSRQPRARIAHPRRSRRARRPLFALGALAAIAVALVLIVPGLITTNQSTTGPQAADAAILRHVEATLSSAPGTLTSITLTEQFTGSDASAPTDTRRSGNTLHFVRINPRTGASASTVVFVGDPKTGAALLRTGDFWQLYDPAHDTIYSDATAGRTYGNSTAVKLVLALLNDPANTLKAQLRMNLLRVSGPVELDGKQALELVSTAGSPRYVYYVDARSYAPLRIVATDDGFQAVTNYSTYRTSPITAQNRNLASLTALHPNAKRVTGATPFANELAGAFATLKAHTTTGAGTTTSAQSNK